MMLRLFSFCLIFLLKTKFVLTESPSVIIVGGGVSGIAAAAKLLENGITNITVLEAENRVGGRIYSVKFGEGHVDIGAEFCHGQQGNAVYELVENFNLLEHDKINLDNVKLYTSKGTKALSDVVVDIHDVVIDYEDDIRNSDSSRSLGDVFLERYNSTVLKKYSHHPEKLNVAVDAIKFIDDNLMLNEGAFTWWEVSAARHFVKCEGDQAMTWKRGGFKIVLDVLTKKYPNPSQKLPIDDKIILNKKVTKIEWGSSKGVVRTSDNTSFTADHVILTPSVGVLKKNIDTLFEPHLPALKKDAIESIGFGGIIKIILHFPDIWWKDDLVLCLIWNKKDLQNTVKEFPDGPKKDGVSWVASISVLEQVASNPHVLVAWVSGHLVSEIEQTSEDVLKRGCMYVFKKFFGKDYNVTEPDQIIWSQWNTNPNFLGTYSYEKAGYFKEVPYQAKLAEPLVNKKGKPILLFAGEATHSRYYANVHGAIEAGRREADRIINLYKHPFSA